MKTVKTHKRHAKPAKDEPVGLSSLTIDFLRILTEMVSRNLGIAPDQISVKDRAEMVRTASIFAKSEMMSPSRFKLRFGQMQFKETPTAEEFLRNFYGITNYGNVRAIVSEIVTLQGSIWSQNGELKVVYPYLCRSTVGISIEDMLKSRDARRHVSESKRIELIRASLADEEDVEASMRGYVAGRCIGIAPLLEFERWPEIWNESWGDFPSFDNPNPDAPKIMMG